MEFTARIEKSPDGWYVGQVEEIPSAIAQGKSIEELKENLLDALKLIFEVNKDEISSKEAENEVIRESLILAN